MCRAVEFSIDGTPAQQIGRKALRKNFGMVLQDTWLKCGSILENIRMGNPGASYDEVVAAAKKAHAHGFELSVCPEGYSAKIGEDGGSLYSRAKTAALYRPHYAVRSVCADPG